MPRHPRRHPGAVVLGALLLVGAVVLVLKWLLITAAILALPFWLWWLLDREQRKSAEWEAQRAAAQRRVNPALEAQHADLLGLPASAAFWRSQPAAEPLPDEAEWQARRARSTKRGD